MKFVVRDPASVVLSLLSAHGEDVDWECEAGEGELSSSLLMRSLWSDVADAGGVIAGLNLYTDKATVTADWSKSEQPVMCSLANASNEQRRSLAGKRALAYLMPLPLWTALGRSGGRASGCSKVSPAQVREAARTWYHMQWACILAVCGRYANGASDWFVCCLAASLAAARNRSCSLPLAWLLLTVRSARSWQGLRGTGRPASQA